MLYLLTVVRRLRYREMDSQRVLFMLYLLCHDYCYVCYSSLYVKLSQYCTTVVYHLSIYHLTISLYIIERIKMIYREMVVNSRTTLRELTYVVYHLAIYHLYAFVTNVVSRFESKD